MASIAWDRLLETVHQRGAILALLNPGSPPVLRIGDGWRALSVPPLTHDDITALTAERFAGNDDHVKLTDGYAVCDFRFGTVAFFQVMAFGYPDVTSLVVSPSSQTRPASDAL
jgi:hypothetical protein